MKNSKILNILRIGLASLFLASCGGVYNVIPYSEIEELGLYTLYIAGLATQSTGPSTTMNVPVVWLIPPTGTIQKLELTLPLDYRDWQDKFWAIVPQIVIANNQLIITACYRNAASTSMAGYWTVPLDLSSSEYHALNEGNSAWAFSVTSNGTDFMIAGGMRISSAGSTVTAAGYWKNGNNWIQITASAPGATKKTYAVGIEYMEDGTNFYVLVDRCNAAGTTIECVEPSYWYNGVTETPINTNIPGYGPMTNPLVAALYIEGENVHFVGYNYVDAGGALPYFVRWDNNVPTVLEFPAGATRSPLIFTAMTSKGSDMYVLGNYTDTSGSMVAGYWKNGVFTLLEPESGKVALTSDAAFFNSQLFIGGMQSSPAGDQMQPTIWIDNGLPAYVGALPSGGNKTGYRFGSFAVQSTPSPI